MVASIINNKIKFTESNDIDDEDMGYTSDVYELDLINASKTISVVLGKPKYTYADQNVVYLPIYALSKDVLVGKIGVFEITTPQLVKLYRDGIIDLAKLSPPLLFANYETPKQIDQLGADPQYYHKLEAAPEIKPVDLDKEIRKEEARKQKQEDSDDENEFRLVANTNAISGEKRKAMATINTGIFTMETGFVAPPMIREETEKDAQDIRTKYRPGSSNNWIEERMKNNNYVILENEGGGDCFFATIRDAYAQIGRKTTVEKLRAILANELTDEVFQQKRKLLLDFSAQKKEIKFQILELESQIISLKKKVDSAEYGIEETKRMVEEANKIGEKRKKLRIEYKNVGIMANEYLGDLTNVKTLEDMRAHIKTASYWADTWAISTLERVLNIKMIIMSEDVNSQGDKMGVLQCGEVDNKMRENGAFSPEFYIITTYGGSHYRLVNYKNKGILSFSEVPYDIKVLVVNKCMERSAGPFYLIQDFRNFKTRLGLDAELGSPVTYADNPEMANLFDESVVFSFYSRAAKAPKPGMGDGERIPETMKAQFVTLAKIDEWRKKLDDTWDKAVLTIDGHRWSSVEHYVQGAKYKKGFPDVYLMFSLDSGSELSGDVKLAKPPAKGPHKGLKEGLRIDTDYALGRDEQERETALKTKFIDNLDMKHLLVSTGKALLMHKEGVGKEPVPDVALMRLRANIM